MDHKVNRPKARTQMFQMLGVFAEFEREIIVERVKAGLQRAKAEGKMLGRPRVNEEVEAKVWLCASHKSRSRYFLDVDVPFRRLQKQTRSMNLRSNRRK